MTIQSRLASLGIALLPPSQPAGSYVDAVRTGNLVFLSGKGPRQVDGSLAKGKVGSDVCYLSGYGCGFISRRPRQGDD
jgi:hypothetical protein